MRSSSTLVAAGVLLVVLGAVLAVLPSVMGGSVSVTTTTTRVPVVTTSVVRVPGGGAPELAYRVYSVDAIMSAVYKVYGDPRLGFWVAKTVVENRGSGPLYDVEVSYRLEGLTEWSEPERFPMVMPGGAVVSLYYPLLPSSLSGLQTATPGRLHVRISYRVSPGGEPRVVETTRPLRILGVHDFVFSSLPPSESRGSFQDLFSNYPLLAAWVTPKDPPVEYFADMAAKLAGGAGATLSDEEALRFLEAAWRLSVVNGITYQTEPESYWAGRSAQWVKYPRDVLRDRSGTCLDTALFFASVAMSQGLRAYIVLMPGHAFPLIELPSGQLVPVETTLLNERVGFDEAVETGVRVAEKAFSGPHLIVDVAGLQAEGITPPELPPMRVEDLHLVVPGAGASTTETVTATATVTHTVTATATETATATPPPPPPTTTSAGGSAGLPEPPRGWAWYVSRGPGPAWAMLYPVSFDHGADVTSEPYEVDFAPPGNASMLVSMLWAPSSHFSVDDLRELAINFFKKNFGAIENTQTADFVMSGVDAKIYAYQNKDAALIVITFTHRGYSYAYVLVGDVDSLKAYGKMAEQMAKSFVFLEG